MNKFVICLAAECKQTPIRRLARGNGGKCCVCQSGKICAERRVRGHVLITMRCHQRGAGRPGKAAMQIISCFPARFGHLVSAGQQVRQTAAQRGNYITDLTHKSMLTQNVRNYHFFSCVVNDTIVGEKKSASMFWYSASSVWEPA